MELHLAVNDISATEGLLDVALGHQFIKAFRLIVGEYGWHMLDSLSLLMYVIVGTTLDKTGFKETLLAHGFRPAGV